MHLDNIIFKTKHVNKIMREDKVILKTMLIAFKKIVDNII